VSERGASVAVITGSTRGIGRAIAEALVRRGDAVVVSGRRAADAERVAGELTSLGPGEAQGVACDVRSPEQARGLIEESVARFGGLDTLVNNAGLGRFAPIQEMSLDDWDVQIRTNLDGVFHCSSAAVPHLIARGGGWIVNIGSLAGRHSFSGGVAYNASKWGLLGMSEAMMLDLRHEGVRVTCVMPGSVNTGFSTGRPDPEADWKLTGEDVARVVVDLLDFPARALPSRVEIRPSRPPRRD
jgi:NAD(P)-dependent dehydrogenase (short-subunit alcohol dehydrogenase family)